MSQPHWRRVSAGLALRVLPRFAELKYVDFMPSHAFDAVVNAEASTACVLRIGIP